MKKISVIIPTYNRGYFLDKSLRSLVNQSLTPYEVVVANNASTDKTAQVIQKYSKLLNLKHVYVEEKGVCKARNAAASQATGDIFAFLDDDCIAEKNWLKEIAQNIQYLDKHYLLGFNYNLNFTSVIANYIYFASLSYVLSFAKKIENKLIIENYLDTKNVVISRKQYEDHKPLFDVKFDQFHFGEDMHLGIRLTRSGYSGMVLRKAIVQHNYIDSIRKFIKKRFFVGRSVLENNLILEEEITKNSGLNSLSYTQFVNSLVKKKLKEYKKVLWFVIFEYTKGKPVKLLLFCLVSLLYDILYFLGYYYQKIKRIYDNKTDNHIKK